MISVYGALTTVVVAVILLLQGTRTSFGGGEAQREMIQLARQVLSGGLSTLAPEDSSRTPASQSEVNTNEGKIGLDPWGHPYQYRVFETTGGYRSVVIWSHGPDGASDIRAENILMSQNGSPLRVLSRADDLAHIESGL